MQTSPEPAPPRARRMPFEAAPKYQLLRVVGSGGMGTTVLARDRDLGRLVVLKYLHESCTTFLERFQREARIMARLAHPSIVPVYEFERFAPRPYLVMGYVPGGNLELARFDPEGLVRALRGVVDALAFAHRHGVVHRDVKPENVLLDPAGRTYLTDFGLALDAREGTQRVGARPVVGTPLAMSPEQVRAEPISPASDVFSLGVTFYRRLTDEWPFRRRTVADVLRAIEHEPPPRPRTIRPSVPRALEAIVLRCLEKDPARRFSADELAAALDRFLARRALLGRALALLRGPPRARPLHPRSPIHPEELS
jgi:serine/threonine-protein kinase